MTVHMPAPTLANRSSFYSDNKLIIGLFGANCSSGRAVTLLEERWSGKANVDAAARAFGIDAVFAADVPF